MMKRKMDTRQLCFLCASTALVLVVLLVIACMMKVDCESIKQESVTVVPSDRVGPQMEQALKSLSDAWREENRNR